MLRGLSRPEEWEDVLLVVRERIKNIWYKNTKKKGGALLSGVGKNGFLSFAQERISSCSLGGFQASMTVEACFVLPFFLFAFLNIISILEVYRLQGNMSAAMHDTAKRMAVYGYEYREARQDAAGTAESLSLTVLYAAARVRGTLGEGYLDNSPIAGGAGAVCWARSKVMAEDDCIDLVAEYRISPPAAIMGYDVLPMYNRLRTRAWTGYDNEGAGLPGVSGEEMVYITPQGSVYHGSRSCTYLRLSIAAVDLDFLIHERNKDGSKYYPCGECAGKGVSTVYITDYGNRYHESIGCSKLKRTVLAVPLSDAEGRTPCGKCAK